MATSITKRYWIDLNDMRITSSLGDRSEISGFTFKSRDASKIGFQIHRGGVPILLSAGSTLVFGIKAASDYAGTYYASVSSFTAATTVESDTANQTDSDFYYGTLDLNTSPITTALGDSTDSVAAVAEVQIDIGGSGERVSSPTYTCTLENDVNRGGEGTPASGDPAWPSDVTELIRFKSAITSLTGGTSADLDNVATTSFTVPVTFAIRNQDATEAWEFWVLESGTDAEDAANGIVRPDDYATTTNEKVWYRKNLFPAVDDDDVSAAASATNYTPAASTVAGHLSGIDTAIGTGSTLVADLSPQLGGQLDVNGQSIGDGTLELLKFSETASAINEITVTNAAIGAGPTVSATGDDVNVDLNLSAKGSGVVKAGGSEIVTAASTTVAVLAGQAGSQDLHGGTASGESLTLDSTSHATKGGVILAADNWLEVPEISAPGTPSAGAQRIYVKSSDGFPYIKNSSGVETPLSGAGRFHTISLPIGDWCPNATAGPAWSNLADDVMGWKFDDSITESIRATWIVPNDADVTADVELKLIWTQDHANAGTVKYQLGMFKGAATTESLVQTGLGSTALLSLTAAGDGKIVVTPAVTFLSDTFYSKDEIAVFALTRNTSGTMTGDYALIGCQLRYRVSDDTATSW